MSKPKAPNPQQLQRFLATQDLSVLRDEPVVFESTPTVTGYWRCWACAFCWATGFVCPVQLCCPARMYPLAKLEVRSPWSWACVPGPRAPVLALKK